MSKEQMRLNRRQFIGTVMAGAAWSVHAFGEGPAAAKTQKRYNVLLIQCDSMDGRVMGCMGDASAYTPNLDKLAAEGVLFRNHYCNSPLCVPSRASMLSSLQTHKCEGWNNNKGLDVKPLSGKGGPADLSDEKLEELEAKGKSPVKYGFEGIAAKDHNYYMDIQASPYLLQCIGKNDFNTGGHTVSARVGAWTRSSGIHLPMKVGQKTEVVKPKTDPRKVKEGDWGKMDECKKWLGEYAASDRQRPFFVYCGLTYPHPAYRTSEYWLSKIDRSKIAVPPQDELPLHPGVAYMKRIKSADRDFDKKAILDVRQTYRAMIAEVDCITGELVKKLEELGLRDSTYVIFTSDHGDVQMEHNLTHKQCLFEPAVRVPLIVAGPGVRKGAVVDDLVSLIDAYPTLMDMTGLPTPKGLDGRSLMPFLKGQSDPARPDWVLSQYHGDYSDTGSFMLRQSDWKYVAWAGYEPQLFNMREDPWEIHNRAKEQPDVVKRMDAQLRGIVDYEAVDAKVKAYDKASFRAWRAQQKPEKYRAVMEDLYTGFGDEQEKQIEKWLQ